MDRDLPDIAALELMARRAEEAGRAVNGVSKSGGASASAGVGGMVLLTSHGFSGAYLGSRHSISMQAIAGEGTSMETDYDFSSTLHAADLDAPEKIGRSAGEKAVARLNPRKVSTRKVPVVFDSHVSGSIVGHLVSAINGASVRAEDELPQGQDGRADFRARHQHHRRSAAPPRPALAAVRRRRRRRQTHGADRGWRTEDLAARQRDRARARSCHHRPRRAERLLDAVAGADQSASGARELSPDELIKDIEEGFYITDLIGSGANMVTGDYSRGAAGFWIEKGQRTYPVSEVTIAGHLLDIFRTVTPANDLHFRYGTNAPTLRLEGLTIAGV